MPARESQEMTHTLTDRVIEKGKNCLRRIKEKAGEGKKIQGAFLRVQRIYTNGVCCHIGQKKINQVGTEKWENKRKEKQQFSNSHLLHEMIFQPWHACT